MSCESCFRSQVEIEQLQIWKRNMTRLDFLGQTAVCGVRRLWTKVRLKIFWLKLHNILIPFLSSIQNRHSKCNANAQIQTYLLDLFVNGHTWGNRSNLTCAYFLRWKHQLGDLYWSASYVNHQWTSRLKEGNVGFNFRSVDVWTNFYALTKGVKITCGIFFAFK